MGTDPMFHPGLQAEPRRGLPSVLFVAIAAVVGVLALGTLSVGVGSAVSMSGERDAIASELVGLRSDVSGARKEKAEADGGAASAKAELATASARLEDVRKQQKDAERTLEAARSELADAAQQAATARALGRDVDERRERLKQVEADLQKAEGTRAANARSITEQEAAISANLGRVALASQKLADAESTIRRATDLGTELSARQSEFAKLGADLSAAKIELSSLRPQIEAARGDLAATEGRRKRVVELDSEIQDKERKAGEVSAQLKSAQVDQGKCCT